MLFRSGDVSALIKLFEVVNPSVGSLYARPPQRKAAADLLKLHDLAWWDRFLKAYATKLQDRYCPKATTPAQMVDKLGAITAYASSLKASTVKII